MCIAAAPSATGAPGLSCRSTPLLRAHKRTKLQPCTVCQAASKVKPLVISEDRLTKAAVNFRQGLKDGIDEDDLVAKELGSNSAKALKGNANWEQYKEPLKARISERAKELQREADESNLLFVAGRRFFEKGEYADATLLFKEAINQQTGGASSRLGGDIQLWLGLAYQATGDEQAAIDLFKEVEKHHPIRTVRKQAGNLKFIMEAPKLERGPDESVSLPLMTEVSKPARRGAGKPRMMRSASSRRISEEELKARNEKFWQDLPLPPALKTPAAAWIIGLTALALAIASVAYRDLLG